MSNIEHELRILEINPDEVQKKLRALGAIKVGEYLYRRHVFETKPAVEGRWIRLRTNGKTTTLTVKQIAADTVDGTSEWESVVDDFETTLIMLEKMGLRSKGYQENKRIEYELDGVQICIDTWPKIPPYVEIEGTNTAEVISSAKKLGFSESELSGLNPQKIYLKYGIDISKVADLSF